jgi:hypothetical protein
MSEVKNNQEPANNDNEVLVNRFSSMTKEEAIKYCYTNKDNYIRDFDSISQGIRQFDCLIAIIESGTINPSELPDYGMEY